ncbi:hypothetical protein LP420_24540 [Massilia sp. B-10]|nr:hypothetical protein LP420_24540 [Massilia sp. B-10]
MPWPSKHDPHAVSHLRAGARWQCQERRCDRYGAHRRHHGRKKTSDLIPLCHPLAITRVTAEFTLDEAAAAVHCRAQVETVGKTGVEMEALMAVQVGLLTIYDMCKAADRGMVITDVQVLEKQGGKSGSWLATRKG